MDVNDFATWAWARHHNVLSWYVRPLFLLPYCYFAYRHRLGGMALTLIALVTSMFWFPAPEQASPGVQTLLDAERTYLTGAWGWEKLAATLLVPVSLAALAIAFWRRSLLWGLALINAMALAKIAWTFVVSPGAGAMALLAPALTGLALCNLVGMALLWQCRTRRRWNPPR